MVRVVGLPVFLVACCALASIYGAVHNQISYTVASVYFHEFKFTQFAISPEFHSRVGASIVGVQASWWMGLLIGVPVYLISLGIKGPIARVLCNAALIVVSVALVVGLSVLGVALVTLNVDTIPPEMIRPGISEPVAFAKAGAIHYASYLGGAIGLVAAMVYLVRAVVISRRS
jgi:hypothetical protein